MLPCGLCRAFSRPSSEGEEEEEEEEEEEGELLPPPLLAMGGGAASGGTSSTKEQPSVGVVNVEGLQLCSSVPLAYALPTSVPPQNSRTGT